jgi:hypothetical protein
MELPPWNNIISDPVHENYKLELRNVIIADDLHLYLDQNDEETAEIDSGQYNL